MVRLWMSAADRSGDPGVTRDDLFAQWLEMVAVLMAARGQVSSRTKGDPTPWAISRSGGDPEAPGPGGPGEVDG